MKKIITAALLLFVVGLMPADAKKKEACFQMYSVRTLIGDPGKYAQNHETVLKDLARYGYTSIEAANYDNGKFYGRTPEEFKADIEAAGLKVLSSHTTRNLNDDEIKNHDFKAALQWWDECIDAHKRAGMKYIVSPWCNVPSTIGALQTICDFYNEVGKRVKAAGMEFGYHNHSHEFQKVEGKELMYDYMLQNTDPENVFFEMDVYWTVRGQQSPVEYFNKYPGRFKLLHIKDHKEIGQSGMVGFDAIYGGAEKAGMQNWVLELEVSSTPDIMLGMKQSIDYLKSAKYVKSTYNK